MNRSNFNSRLLSGHKKEYEEYTSALITYKIACSQFTKIRQKYKYSTDKAERLLYLEARESYSTACRIYNEARAKWERLVTKVRMQTEHGDALGLNISEVLGIRIPLSAKDLKEAHKERVIEESFKPGELERLQSEIQHASDRKVTKASFLSSDKAEKDPLAGDFEPLS